MLDAADALATGTLNSADPAKRILADLFKAAINADTSAAWRNVVGYAGGPSGLGSTHALYGTYPVNGEVLELEPDAVLMTQRRAKFPMLAIHRFGDGALEPFTLEESRFVQSWLLHWVMGPGDTAEAHKLLGIAVEIRRLVERVIRAKGHPAYQDGASVFGGASGIGGITLARTQGPGQAKFGDSDEGTIFWAYTLELRITEYSDEQVNPLDYVGDLEAADFNIGVGGGEGVIGGLFPVSTDVDDP
jgi:hypothetical protein